MTENYGALEKMIVRRVPDTDPLLSTIAEMFASVGLCEQAVEAYTKRGQYVCPALPSHSLPPPRLLRHSLAAGSSSTANWYPFFQVQGCYSDMCPNEQLGSRSRSCARTP